MENFEQSKAHEVLAKAYSTMPVGEPSIHIKASREALAGKEPIVSIKSNYHPEAKEVVTEVKNHFNDTVTTTMYKVREMQDLALLEALPDDVLRTLYMSIKCQMKNRGLPL